MAREETIPQQCQLTVSMADMNPPATHQGALKQLIPMPLELLSITQLHYCATQVVAESSVPRVPWPGRIHLH